MKPRFGTLISLWERRLDAAREELGRIQAAIIACEADIAACIADRAAAVPEDPRWREHYDHYCLWSRGREAAHRHNLEAFRHMAEQQRAAVADCRRRLKSFELLQEREDKRLARLERRREEAALVDHALRRWMEVGA